MRMSSSTNFWVLFDGETYETNMDTVKEMEQNAVFQSPELMKTADAGFVLISIGGEERVVDFVDALKFCRAATKVYKSLVEVELLNKHKEGQR
ncbi:hypothetical protein [Bacillus phage BvP]